MSVGDGDCVCNGVDSGFRQVCGAWLAAWNWRYKKNRESREFGCKAFIISLA